MVRDMISIFIGLDDIVQDGARGGSPADCADKGYRGFTVSDYMCKLNELMDLMLYIPDPDFNSVLAPDTLVVSVNSETAGVTTSAPGNLTITLDVQAVNDPPQVRPPNCENPTP